MKFLDPLVVQWTGAEQWIVHNELRAVTKAGESITVPAGMTTDLASIPRAMWPVLSPAGKWALASVLHDFLYQERIYPQEKCDEIFLEAMLDDGVDSTTAWMMYAAIRAFGEGEYEDDD